MGKYQGPAIIDAIIAERETTMTPKMVVSIQHDGMVNGRHAATITYTANGHDCLTVKYRGISRDPDSKILDLYRSDAGNMAITEHQFVRHMGGTREQYKAWHDRVMVTNRRYSQHDHEYHVVR